MVVAGEVGSHKGTEFFSRKSLRPLTQSFSENFVFFVSRFLEEKKNRCIFFPRKSLKATHSGERQLPLGSRYFYTFAVFFFSNEKVFFFPRKCLRPTHSLVLRGAEKIKNRGGKKNSIFTHSLEKPQKVSNFKLFRGKKYGNFVLRSRENLS